MKLQSSIVAILAVAAAVFAGGVQSAAASAAASRIELHGFVPVICRYEVNSSVVSVQDGTADFGPVQQFCNSGRGYVFTVQHDPNFHGLFVVDGHAVPASPSGLTVLEQSSTPTARTISFRIEKMDPDSSPSLSLAMIANT